MKNRPLTRVNLDKAIARLAKEDPRLIVQVPQMPDVATDSHEDGRLGRDLCESEAESSGSAYG